jgi:hypothetical protein
MRSAPKAIAVVEERLELDLGIAEHVRVRRAAGAVLGEEGREDAVLVFGGEIDRLDLDADALGHRDRVHQVLARRAVLVIVVVLPVLHEEADDVVPRALEQQRGDGRVHSSRQSDDDFHAIDSSEAGMKKAGPGPRLGIATTLGVVTSSVRRLSSRPSWRRLSRRPSARHPSPGRRPSRERRLSWRRLRSVGLLLFLLLGVFLGVLLGLVLRGGGGLGRGGGGRRGSRASPGWRAPKRRLGRLGRLGRRRGRRLREHRDRRGGEQSGDQGGQLFHVFCFPS